MLFVSSEVTQQRLGDSYHSKLLLLASALHDAEGVAANHQSHQYLAWEPVPVATEAGESGGR